VEVSTNPCAWERREFFRATRHNVPVFSILDIAMYVVFFAIGFWSNEVPLFIGMAIFIHLTGNYVVQPMALWVKGIGMREARFSTFTDDGFVTSSKSVTIRRDWDEFPRSKESKDFYHLEPHKRRMATAIRKRTFSNMHDEAAFREMLRIHTSATLWPNVALDGPITTTDS
jgi:hypothetical protein